jgi:hypothetical protein
MFVNGCVAAHRITSDGFGMCGPLSDAMLLFRVSIAFALCVASKLSELFAPSGIVRWGSCWPDIARAEMCSAKAFPESDTLTRREPCRE